MYIIYINKCKISFKLSLEGGGVAFFTELLYYIFFDGNYIAEVYINNKTSNVIKILLYFIRNMKK